MWGTANLGIVSQSELSDEHMSSLVTCFSSHNYNPSYSAHIMADAMCGPSNPLQTFRKQTSIDRTLQQDRLRSRQSPTQVCLGMSSAGSHSDNTRASARTQAPPEVHTTKSSKPFKLVSLLHSRRRIHYNTSNTLLFLHRHKPLHKRRTQPDGRPTSSGFRFRHLLRLQLCTSRRTHLRGTRSSKHNSSLYNLNSTSSSNFSPR